MNIFDAHISGSLSVSSSAEISGNLTVLGTINATVSGTSTNALTASEAPKYTLTSSFNQFTSSYTTGSFTGSFKGDGTNLYNIPASGVTGLNLNKIISGSVSASLSPNRGFEVNTDATFTGSVNITGSIYLNGNPIGTGKLDETTFNSFTSSYNTVSASIDTRLDNLESFSSSIDSNFVSEGEFGTYTGSLNSFTSSTLMTIGALNSESSSIRNDFNSFTSSYTNVSSSLDTRLDTLETLSGSFTGSFSGSFRGDGTNLYNIPASGVTGLNLTQIADGSVTASVSNTNGLRVNSKTEITGSLIVTNGITGSIDYSDITNKPTLVSGSSQIEITGTTGYSTFSSSISSSIDSLSSSIATTDSNQNTRLGLIETSTGSLNTFTSSALTRFETIETSTGSLNSFTSSALTRVLAIETSTGSLNLFTSSIDTTIKTKLNTENVVSGSGQISYTGITNIPSGLVSGSSQVLSGTGIWSGSSQLPNGVVSGSSQVDITSTTNYTSFSSSIATTDLNQNNRLDSIETKTGSYATTGSNVFKSNQTISGSVIITENLTVFGSSSITYVTSSQLRVDDNIITVNTASPGSRFGGIEVYDSGSVLNATGSLLWDSVNNKWIYQNSSDSGYGGGMLLSGPRSSGSLGSELSLTSGKIARSAGGDHLNDSIITEYGGTTIGISGNLEISGSLVIPSTPLVSGSSQISFNGITDKPTLVSGSSQVLNGSGVWSGSSQLPSGVVSGSSQVLSGTGIWSGSAQLPSGVVSGSSQITYSGISGIPSGIISGSSQVSFGSISGIPSGLVSGSAQITLSATTGYGSVINQALLTTSTPTFSTVSATTFTGALSGNATTATALTSMNISQFTNNSAYLTGITSGNVTTALGYTPYNATNPNGYITGINSSAVTTALGYTPYNATNPSGYISSITSGNVTTALGYTPYNSTNPNGYITGISFASVSSKPTTLSGYGITDSIKSNGTLTGNIDSDWGESFTTFDPIPTGTPPLQSPNIRTINIGANYDRRTQLAFDYNTDGAYFRRRTNSAWTTWREFIHSGNIGSQTVATAGALSSMNISQFTNNSGYLTSITSGNVTTALGYTPYNATNPNGYISSITSGNVTTALGFTPYNATNPSGYITGISFASVSSKPTTISGYGITDAITTGNIGSQSVSYASTAGTAGNITAYTINQSVGTGNSPTFVDLYARSHFMQRNANTTHGISWYSSGYTAWCQYMATVNVASTGPTGNITSPAAGNFVTSWALRSFIENVSGYGWTWEAGSSTGQPSIVAEMSSATGNFYTKGSITVGGIFTENSSIRYKTNIETIKYGLDKILQMRGVTYTRKDSGNIEAGVIAEEMYDVTPLVVLKNKDGEVDSVSYGRINAYLIEAVKELKQEINEQNLIITELKGKLGL